MTNDCEQQCMETLEKGKWTEGAEWSGRCRDTTRAGGECQNGVVDKGQVETSKGEKYAKKKLPGNEQKGSSVR